MNLPTIDQLPFPDYYRVENRYLSTTQYVLDNVQYCYSFDGMFAVPLKNRTATSLIGGRILAQKLAEQTPLTLEILTGEMGGAPPLPDNHPLKGAAVAATSMLMRSGWRIARCVADGQFTLEMDRRLVDERKLPEFVPLAFIYTDTKGYSWDVTFTAMDLIYTLAGGQFTVPAGMAFHYALERKDSQGATQTSNFSVEVYIQKVPEVDRDVQMNGVRQLIADRNRIFEEIANEAINHEIEGILGNLKELELLTDAVVEAAKAYDEAAKAPTEAANDATPA